MKEESAIEMYVGGLMVDPNTQAPVIVLKDESEEVVLPIWIGVPEATSIASALKQVQMSRPLTHDLMKTVFDEVGIKIQRVVIHDLRDSTYFAELVATQGDKVIVLDSRPSDALAMAIRASAPIFVLTKVLEEAKVLFSASSDTESQATESQSGEQSGEEGSAQDAPESDNSAKCADSFDKVQDFRIVDKDKWKDLLEDLDPDDFKFRQ
jgi:bifunctional DNase/RNase